MHVRPKGGMGNVDCLLEEEAAGPKAQAEKTTTKIDSTIIYGGQGVKDRGGYILFIRLDTEVEDKHYERGRGGRKSHQEPAHVVEHHRW